VGRESQAPLLSPLVLLATRFKEKAIRATITRDRQAAVPLAIGFVMDWTTFG
jgi:hypothetical protein